MSEWKSSMGNADRDELWQLAANPDPRTRYDALVQLTRLLCAEGETEQEATLAAAALDAARLTHDDACIAESLFRCAMVHWERGNWLDAAAGMVDAGRANSARAAWGEAGECWFGAAIAMLEAGVQGGVWQYIDLGNAAFAKTDLIERWSGTLLLASHKFGDLGNTDDAVVLALRARQLGIDHHDAGVVLHASSHLIHSLSIYGRHEQANELLEASLADAHAQSRHADIVSLAIVGAHARLRAEQPTAAAALIESAIAATSAQVAPARIAELMLFRSRIRVNAFDDFTGALVAAADAEALVESCVDLEAEAREQWLDAIALQASLLYELDDAAACISRRRRMVEVTTGEQQYICGITLIWTCAQFEEWQQCLDFIDATSDVHDAEHPVGGSSWLYRRLMRAEALAGLDRWQEADAVAAQALADAADDVEERYIGDLHYLRGRAALASDVDVSLTHLEHACDAYRSAEADDMLDELREQFQNIAVLVASRER